MKVDIANSRLGRPGALEPRLLRLRADGSANAKNGGLERPAKFANRLLGWAADHCPDCASAAEDRRSKPRGRHERPLLTKPIDEAQLYRPCCNSSPRERTVGMMPGRRQRNRGDRWPNHCPASISRLPWPGWAENAAVCYGSLRLSSSGVCQAVVPPSRASPTQYGSARNQLRYAVA